MSNEVLIKNGNRAEWGADSAPIEPERLPEGYPYKEVVTIEWDGNIAGRAHFTLAPGYNYCKVSDLYFDKGDLIYFSGSLTNGNPVDSGKLSDSTNSAVWGSTGVMFVSSPTTIDDVINPGETISIPEAGLYFLYSGNTYLKNLTISYAKKISSDFLPLATPTAAGAMKQAAAVADVTAAPTAEEFNALLKSLRDAGILATE